VIFLRLLPVIFSLLALAAHFLRAGQALPVALTAGLLVLLGARRPWVPRLLQAALALAAVEWVRTLFAFVGERLRRGEPVVRLVAILAGATLFTLLSALVFRAAPVRRWYAGDAGA
jgi:hypothetical protein